MKRLLASTLIALAGLAGAAAPAPAAEQRPRFDTRLFALVPLPGYPAHAYVARNGRVYEGTYDNPRGDTMPSRVLEYDGEGTLLRSWTMRGQDLSGPHGVQVATADHAGRLILLDKRPPRIVRLTRVLDEQETIARFPAGAIPNHAAWGPDGSLYITDYGQPILWRLAPGAKEPEKWLESPALDGGDFNATGIKLGADRRSLLVATQSSAGGGAGNPSTGRLYSIGIGTGGEPQPPRQLWESRPADGPDGFAIARSGTIYMTLLLANQLAVIGADGVERERFPRAPATGANGSRVPFDSPASAEFLGSRLIVAQQSFFAGNRAHQALLDVHVGEEGLAEFIPPGPKKAPAKKKKKRKRKRRS